MKFYRSHYSKDVTSKDHNKIITVAGWIEDIRNIGSIAFIILRDRKGTLQVTALKKENPELFEKLVVIPRESVITVNGVCKKSDKARNGYEIIPKEFEVLSSAETPSKDILEVLHILFLPLMLIFNFLDNFFSKRSLNFFIFIFV